MKFGVDLGGTKIEIIALNAQGVECYRHRIETPQTYPQTIQAVAALVVDAEAFLGLEASSAKASVGVGIPGSISQQTGRVKNANSTWLNGQKLDLDLASLLARDVRVANDANCFAVSEAVDGAGAAQRVVFGVILGTGCGAGLAIDKQVHSGRNGLGGEWGHNPLPWMEPEEFQSTSCFCGKYDCIERYISGSGFSDDYFKLTGQRCSGQEIMQRVAEEQFLAQKTFHLYLDRLARALAHVINMIDPDIIVLGGGMSNIDALYPALPLILPRYVFGGECSTEVVANQYGDSSGVRGAAWLWNDGVKVKETVNVLG